MKQLLFLAACLFLFFPSTAQLPCSSAEANQALYDSHPEYHALRLKADSIMRNPPAVNNTIGAGLVTGGIHYIPVVVHIVHGGDAIGSYYNPTDQQVIDYITALNQGFSATYPNYPTAGNGGQDIGIQFVLAQRSPDCQPTNGIVRVDASTKLSSSALMIYNYIGVSFDQSPGISFDTLASMSYWPNLDYYNIWLVKGIPGHSGFAYYPLPSVSTIYDGSVIGVTDVTIGTPNPHVIAHELGHGFDLRHTFEGEQNGTCPPNANCQTDGDFICDTDPHLSVTNTCNPADINPCTNQPYGDVVTNYMSYSCYNHFSADQKTRMLNALINLRPLLDASLGGTPPGPLMPSPTITIATPQTTYCTGSQVTFTATVSYGGLSPAYHWKINGATVATTNVPSFTTTTLTNNDIVSCELTSSVNPACVNATSAISNAIQVTVTSTLAPTISISSNLGSSVCSGQVVSYTATSANTGIYAPLYQWYVNGSIASSTAYYFFYTPVDGDVITCQLYANTTCTASPLMFSAPITMQVTPVPQPAIVIASDTTSVCSGSPVTVTAICTNGGTTPQVYWYLDGVYNAYGPGPLPIIIPDTSEITAVVMATSTCTSSPLYGFSNSIWVNADTAVTPSVSISTSNDNFCAGSMATFNANAANTGPTPAYTWFINGIAQTNNTNTFTYPPADNDMVSCKLNTSNICVTTDTALSNNISMQAIDTVSVSVLQSSGASCEGDTITLITLYNNLDTNTITSISWTVNGIAAGTDDTLEFALAAGMNSISVSTDFPYVPACMSTNTLASSYGPMTATPHTATPVITAINNYFSSNYANGQNQWYEMGTGALAGEVNQLFYPSSAGSYYVIADANGCPSLPSDTLIFMLPTASSMIEWQDNAPFYPNPSVTGTFITPTDLEGQDAVIFDNIGQIIRKLKLEKSLYLNDLSTGIYFLKLTGTNTSRVFKLVIDK